MLVVQVTLYYSHKLIVYSQKTQSIDQDMFGSNPSEHETKEGSSKYKALGDWRASCQALLKDCAAIFGELPLEERIQQLCIMLGAPKATHTTQPISRETAAHNVLHMRRLLETTDILTEEAANLREDKKAAIIDSFLPLYRAIVSLAETNLGLSHSDTQQISQLAPSFSLDMGVIGPLYEVSRHCRDPTLRRKIVHLLRMSNRQEGLLNSVTYAKIVETIIEVEEGGLRDVKESKDIPLQSRISQHCLSFDVKRLKHTISYKPLVGSSRGFFHRDISR